MKIFSKKFFWLALYGSICFIVGFLTHRSGIVWRLHEMYQKNRVEKVSYAVLDHDEALLESLKPVFRFNPGDPVLDREHFLNDARLALQNLLNMGAQISDFPMDVVESQTLEQGIVLEKLNMRVESDLSIPVYFLLPSAPKKPMPIVLALHGHGGGAKGLIGRASDYHHSIALELARQGMAVIVPEHRGFGETGATGWGDDPIHTRDVQINLYLGRASLGLFLRDALAALSYALKRPEVDPSNVGVCGGSLGGILALFAAALDPRIKAVASSAAFQNKVDTLRPIPSSALPISEFEVAGFLEFFDYQDIAAMIAPRPLMIDIDPKDQVYYKNPFYHLENVYQNMGNRSALKLHLHSEGHSISAKAVSAWMKEVLGGNE